MDNYRCIPLGMKVSYETLSIEQYHPYLSNKMKWLQRICFKILEKLGARKYTEYKQSIRSLDKENVLTKILDNQMLARELSNPYRMDSCSTVIVGRDILRELQNNSDLWQYARFTVKANYRNALQIVGHKEIDVIFCPWMEGMFILPPEFDK
jgi:hypothetical protein